MADDDAASGQHFLDHAQAQREAEIQPDRVADDLGREAIAGIAGASWYRHLRQLPALPPIRKPASSQVDGAHGSGYGYLSLPSGGRRNFVLRCRRLPNARERTTTG